jgi:hypothetical protein
MAERLVTLPAKQVAWVWFPVPAWPTFSVEMWLFSVTLRQGARSRALQLRLQNGLKNCSSASKGDPHLEAWEGVGEDTERSYSAKSVWNITERLEREDNGVDSLAEFAC